MIYVGHAAFDAQANHVAVGFAEFDVLANPVHCAVGWCEFDTITPHTHYNVGGAIGYRHNDRFDFTLPGDDDDEEIVMAILLEVAKYVC